MSFFKNKRKWVRYFYSESIELIGYGERLATGTLIDVSASGASFRTTNNITVGKRYILASPTFGNIPCVVIRADIDSVGLHFDVPLNTKMRIKNKLLSMNLRVQGDAGEMSA